jgi:hypothetical protein
MTGMEGGIEDGAEPIESRLPNLGNSEERNTVHDA